MVQELSIREHENSKKSRFDRNPDRLSSLPLGILQQILSYLDTMEVIRTSVLSRKWRYKWASFPYLNFDMVTFNDDLQKGERFWEYVKWVLLARNGNHVIKRLGFIFEFDDSYSMTFDWVLHLAATHKVHELEVSLCGEESNVPFRLCRKLCESLRVLKLYAGLEVFLVLRSKLSEIRILRLHRVKNLDDDLLSNISFENLEELFLQDCGMENVNAIHLKAYRLKKFTFVNKFLDMEEEDEVDTKPVSLAFHGDLMLWVPRLTYFYYAGPVLHNFVLRYLHSLEDAFICFFLGDKARYNKLNLHKIIKGLQHVKTLTLSTVPLKRFSPSFSQRAHDFDLLPNLLCLKLDVKCNLYHMEGLTHLLKLAPSLKKLVLNMREGWSECENSWKLLDWDIPCLSHSVEVIEIYNFSNSALSMLMVESLLQYGKMLNQMLIVFKDEKAMQENFHEILSFPRASEEVVISFPVNKKNVLFWSESDNKMDLYLED